jgi:hypothetical protein
MDIAIPDSLVSNSSAAWHRARLPVAPADGRDSRDPASERLATSIRAR